MDRRAIASRRSVRLVALVRQVMREQTAEQVGLSASGAAFWLVIAVLPTAIAAVSIYGLVVSPQTVATNLAGHDWHLPGRLRRVTRSRTQRPTRLWVPNIRPAG